MATFLFQSQSDRMFEELVKYEIATIKLKEDENKGC